jgi:hypothetical protein
MSYKPSGSEEWPEHPCVTRLYADTHYDPHSINDGSWIEPIVFDLVWYYSAQYLEGFHNIAVPPHPEGFKPYSRGYVSPAYSCKICDHVMLVPFPLVEKQVELLHWLREHVAYHNTEG